MSNKIKLCFTLRLCKEAKFYLSKKKNQKTKELPIGTTPKAESYQTSYTAPAASFSPPLLKWKSSLIVPVSSTGTILLLHFLLAHSPSSFTVTQSLFCHLFIKKNEEKRNYLFISPESRTAQKARTYFWEVCEHPWHCLWWQYYLHSLALLYLLKTGEKS